MTICSQKHRFAEIDAEMDSRKKVMDLAETLMVDMEIPCMQQTINNITNIDNSIDNSVTNNIQVIVNGLDEFTVGRLKDKLQLALEDECLNKSSLYCLDSKEKIQRVLDASFEGLVASTNRRKPVALLKVDGETLKSVPTDGDRLCEPFNSFIQDHHDKVAPTLTYPSQLKSATRNACNNSEKFVKKALTTCNCDDLYTKQQIKTDETKPIESVINNPIPVVPIEHVEESSDELELNSESDLYDSESDDDVNDEKYARWVARYERTQRCDEKYNC